jgi:hypothetical protein
MRSILIFIRLVPYLVLSAALVYFLAFIPQSKEYLALVQESFAKDPIQNNIPKLAVNTIYYLLLCFLAGSVFHDILRHEEGRPLSRPRRIILCVLFVVIAYTPVVVVVGTVLKGSMLTRFGLLTLATCVAVLAAISSIALKATLFPIARGRPVPDNYFGPISLIISFLLIVALFVGLSLDLVGVSHTLGAIGVIVGALAAIQGTLILLRYLVRRGYAVFSIIIAVLIFSQAAAYWIAPRYVKSTLSKPNQVPLAKEGFEKWLEARRGQILDYRKNHDGARYPVFVVAAQGGGYYAAYHAALFLARIQDRCPQFGAHLFAISSVSGGSLGAAVFAEAVRLKKASLAKDGAEPACQSAHVENGEYETVVRDYFNYDFLTPLIASTFFFDIPSAIVPVIRLGPDRGNALQQSFEAAWRQAARTEDKHDGLAQPFYGRWDAGAPVPALFLNTTNVTIGIPQLISELDLRARPDKRTAAIEKFLETHQLGDESAFLHQLAKHFSFSQSPFVNLLEFNESVDFPLSFAVTSSARFPYLTPTSLIETGKAADNGLLAKAKYMQLLDGGMVDNSGLFTASQIKGMMNDVLDPAQGDPKFKDLKSEISVQLIYFSHDPTSLYRPDEARAVPEIQAPLSAFDRIRMNRRESYQALTKNFEFAREVVLFDGGFNAPLSWSLSNATKRNIEIRSGGLEEETADRDKVCCILSPGPDASPTLSDFVQDVPIALSKEDEQKWKKETEANKKVVYRNYVPNAEVFAAILADLGLKGQ